MPFAPLIDPLPTLRLPLRRVTMLGGPRDIPFAYPDDRGVLVSRPGSVAAYSHGLKEERWTHRGVEGLWELYRGRGGTVLIKPGTPLVSELDRETGAIVRTIDTRSQAFLTASSDHNVLLTDHDTHTLIAVDWFGRTAWEWKYDAFCHVLALPDHYAIVEASTKLRVLDAISGAELWRAEAEITSGRGPRDSSNHITAGWPSLVRLGDELMTIVGDGRIHRRDLATGELRAQGQTPFRGASQVTATSIFILSGITCELTEYDHRSMQEVGRESLASVIEPLFGTNPVQIISLLVGTDAIAWSTLYGKLMGIERRQHAGTRAKWIDALGNVAMPIAVPPIVSHGYLYYRAMSTRPNVATGLVCYESSV